VDFEELKRYRQLMVATRSDSEEKKRLRVAAEVWWVESQWVIVELVKRKLGWAFVPGTWRPTRPPLPGWYRRS
jgi:hypothetical protein